MQNTPDRNSPSDNQSIQTSYSNNDNNNIQTSYSNNDNNNNNNNTPIYNTTIIIKSRNNNINTNEKEIQSKGDLFVMVKILLLFLLIKQEWIFYGINIVIYNYNIIYLQDKCISC